MLDKHLLVATRPQADAKNIVCWGNYRITVLQDRLFRLEYSENRKFRDEATQAVWYRDMLAQEFSIEGKEGKLYIQTLACVLVVAPKRKDCRVLLNGKLIKIDNSQNLKGTYRTLDGYDGDTHVGLKNELKKDQPKTSKIQLGNGVCSRNGIAVFDDSKSLTLGEEGPCYLFAVTVRMNTFLRTVTITARR